MSKISQRNLPGRSLVNTRVCRPFLLAASVSFQGGSCQLPNRVVAGVFFFFLVNAHKCVDANFIVTVVVVIVASVSTECGS